jgi:CheY-like chemotaxis protein
MEAVGRLAGGVAHDFNNILTTIQGYCDLALGNPLLPVSLRDDVEEIKHSALSAASLTKQLLAFSRRQIIDPVVLDLNGVLRQTERMLQRLIGEDIRIVLRLDPGLKAVRIDPAQVEQIVMNLAINARDAMPTGGTLTIETATVELDDTYARQHLAVVPGEYVMVAVSDTGEGMNPDVLAHVFEPFFTTKPIGKGTGLGLATVYGIVKQNHGNVWVYSEPGRGATFKIYFPALSREAARESPVAATPATPVGTETVLVVEDDARLRLLVRKSLERFGYTVLPTGNGADALKVAAAHTGSIELLLTDVVMPGMNGTALAREFAHVRPAAKVLFCSGYTENAIVHHGVLDAGIAFLQKPYSPLALAQKVREVLDAPRAV